MTDTSTAHPNGPESTALTTGDRMTTQPYFTTFGELVSGQQYRTVLDDECWFTKDSDTHPWSPLKIVQALPVPRADLVEIDAVTLDRLRIDASQARSSRCIDAISTEADHTAAVRALVKAAR